MVRIAALRIDHIQAAPTELRIVFGDQAAAVPEPFASSCAKVDKRCPGATYSPGFGLTRLFVDDGITGLCATVCYMETVGVRELRQNASALLDRVEHGGVSIEITNHRHPVARLVPIVRHSQSSRAQLVESGVLRPGRGDLLGVEPSPMLRGAPSTADLLAGDRDDR